MFETQTREVIKARMLAALNETSGLTAIEGGFADQCFGPPAVELEKFYASLDAMFYILAVDESCGPLIDVAAGNITITRKDGVKARANVTFIGESGTYLPAGTVFSTATGLLYDLNEAVTLDSDGAGSGVLVAQEVGSRYNVAAGAIDRMLVNPVGLDSFSVEEAKGGVDIEGDKPLVDRYYDRLQRPATSGNPNHYREWATEVPGVGDAKVISTVQGAGTVGVTLVSADFGPVDDTIVAEALANIQSKRPVGLDEPPYVDSAEALAINVTVVSKLDTSATASMVKEAFQEKLGEYLRSLVKAKYDQVYDGPDDDSSYILSYNRVATILMTLPGVVDYTTLTINGGKVDVTIGKDQVPVVGEVTVT